MGKLIKRLMAVWVAIAVLLIIRACVKYREAIMTNAAVHLTSASTSLFELLMEVLRFFLPLGLVLFAIILVIKKTIF